MGGVQPQSAEGNDLTAAKVQTILFVQFVQVDPHLSLEWDVVVGIFSV